MESSLLKKVELNDLGEELADVLFVLICLANQTGGFRRTKKIRKKNCERSKATFI